jgi:F-BAR domain only protein
VPKKKLPLRTRTYRYNQSLNLKLTRRSESEEALRNLKIRDQPIAEDETEAQRALNDMASQLRMVRFALTVSQCTIADTQQQAQISGRMPSVRGRRDVRNTMFIPNSVLPTDARNMPNIIATPAISTGAAAAVAAGTADLVSPIKRAETPGTIPEDRAISDSTSVHSGHSLAGLVHHPELHEPGLNASIVETVSTSFSGGIVSRSSVVGEIALAYNQTSNFSDLQTDTIRIENFQDLEKVAANPAFVTALMSEKGKEPATGEDRAGEYSVALSAIKRPAPTIALKYQLHLDEANLSAYSPVLFTPAWQIQDSQASVMVVYAINPAFSKALATTTLKNVVITVALDTSQDAGKAVSAMMAPTAGASFKRKQSLVVWRFPEFTVDAEQKRLLARFITSGSPPKAGSIETKWELPNIVGSGLSVSTLAGEASDPFADESANAGQARSWNNIPCAKKLVSGRYSAS